MVIWALYVVIVSALLGVAALCAEQAARLRRTSTRWYWLMAILASILVPAVIASVSVQAPNIIGPATQKVLVLRDATSIPLSPQQWVKASNAQVEQWRSFDSILKTAWLFSSAGMLLILITHALLLQGRKRQWRRAHLLDREVLVSTDVGPAVVGFLYPTIVVPRWVDGAARQTQLAIMAHEQGHLEANDPQLFTVALFLLVAIPWNLPLWWQLRRLRHAIEVDCDARVVRGGQDALAYSESLIAVGERQSAYVGAVAAMSESPSLLEQRIRILLSQPARWWKVSAAALVCLSMIFVGAAAQVSPPNAQSSPLPQEIAVDAATLRRYVGYYRIGDAELQAVMTVTLKGTQLVTQITGQPPVAVYPLTPTHFILKYVVAGLDFATDATGSATALILHQNGRDMTMPRIDDALAARFNAELASRVQSNTPQPGSEADVHDALERLSKAMPQDYSKMSPQLALAAQQQAEVASETVTRLGALQTLSFEGVAAQGADTYLARFDKGALLIHIQPDAQGTITGMLLQPYP